MGVVVAKVTVNLNLSKFAIVDKPKSLKLTFVCEGEPEPVESARWKIDIDTAAQGVTFKDLGGSQYEINNQVEYGTGNSSGGLILRPGAYLLDQIEIQGASGPARLLTGDNHFSKAASAIVIPESIVDSYEPQIAVVTYTFTSVQ